MAAKGYRRSIVIDFDTTQVTGGTAEINRQLKVLDSEFKKASQEANLYGTGLDKLGVEHENLSHKMELQKQRVDAIKVKYDEASNRLESHRRTMAESNDTSQAAQTQLKNLEKRVDNVRIEYNKAETELTKLDKQVKDSTDNLIKQESALGQTANKVNDFAKKSKDAGVDLEVLTEGMQKIGVVFTAIGAASLKAYMTFDESMAKVRTIADTTQVSFEDLSEGALDLSDKYGIAAAEMAEGLYETLSASVSTADGLAFLENSSRLAIAGFTDTASAVNILSSFTNAYGLTLDEQINLTDMLIKAQKEGKFTIDELGGSFGDIAGLAATANVPIDELLATIATTTSQGVGASQAITGLKSILSSTIKVTDQAATEADNLGLKFNVAALRSKGLAGFLDDVNRATRGNEESLANLFGRVEGLNTVLIATNSGADKFASSLDEISNSAGTTEDAIKAMESPGRRFSISLDTLKNAAIKLGDTLSPLLDIFAGILSVISSIPTPVLAFATVFGVLLGVVGTAAKSLLMLSAAFTLSGVSATIGAAGLTKILVPLLAIVAAIALIVALVLTLTKSSKEASSSIKGLADTASNAASSVSSKVPSGYKYQYASGVSNHPGGRALVGEEGPEVVDLPQGSRVYTARQSRAMLAGAGGMSIGNINFNVSVADLREFNESMDLLSTLRQKFRAATGSRN